MVRNDMPVVAVARSPDVSAVAAASSATAQWLYSADPVLMRFTPACDSSATVGVPALVPTAILTGFGATAVTMAVTAAMSGGYGAKRTSAPASANAVSRRMVSSRSLRPCRKLSVRPGEHDATARYLGGGTDPRDGVIEIPNRIRGIR